MFGGRRQIRGASYDDASAVVAYVATDMTKPTELYVADTDGRNERRLTHFNDALNARGRVERRRALHLPERRRARDRGLADEAVRLPAGQEVSGGALHPRRSALASTAKGGSTSSRTSRRRECTCCSRTRAARAATARTSPTRTRGRWGAEDYEDLMKATDIAAKRADVDSTRMGVTGGSYGGFMTAWITTKTNRFTRGTDRPHDHRLDVLVRRVRRAGAHGVRVLRQAVGQLGDVRHALADPLRVRRCGRRR